METQPLDKKGLTKADSWLLEQTRLVLKNPRIIGLLLLVALASVTSLVIFSPFSASTPVPHLPDEITLLKLKVDPAHYVDETFIVCVALQVDDYYNYHYLRKRGSHYSLAGYQLGQTFSKKGPIAWFYLDRSKGQAIVDGIRRVNEKGKSVVTRVKGTLLSDKKGDMIEVLDVQMLSASKGWQPWVIGDEGKRVE